MISAFDKEKMDLLLSRPLSASSWEKLFSALFRRRLDADEIKALLLFLARRGEEVEGLWGCLKAIRRVERVHSVSLPFLVDVCGTGGDGQRTFNISTVSCFVIAAAGGYVAKHGNRSVSSQVGSSDLMEALGIRLDTPFPRMLQALRQYHLGYFHAPFYHPSFSEVQRVRRELGIRTLFNLLGPLVNPVSISYQMVGVSKPEWLPVTAAALRRLHRRRAAVYRSASGLDELSTQEPSDILYLEAGKMRRYQLDPRRLGFTRGRKGAYAGGNLQTNREIALGILENRLRGPQQEVVLLTSGFALWLTGIAASLKEGIDKSRWTLRRGRALDLLKAVRRFTQSRKL